MDDRAKVRSRQLVINIEETFCAKFAEVAEKEGISVSALGRRVVIRHLMEQGILPSEAVLDALL